MSEPETPYSCAWGQGKASLLFCAHLVGPISNTFEDWHSAPSHLPPATPKSSASLCATELKFSPQLSLQKLRNAAELFNYHLADRHVQEQCKCTLYSARGHGHGKAASDGSMVCAHLNTANLPAEVILNANTNYPHAD